MSIRILTQQIKHLQKRRLSDLNKPFNVIVKESINYNNLISRLMCDNLDNCPCVKFVNNLSLKDFDIILSPWLPMLKTTENKWCPCGPDSPPCIINQEEEEIALAKEIMIKEMDLYYFDDDEEEENIAA